MPVEDENAALDDDSFRPHRRSELERDEAWDAEAKASEDAGELTVVRAKDGVHLVATVSSERTRGRGRAARGGHRIGDRGAPRILRSIRRVPRRSRARCHHVRLSRHRRLPAGCEEADDARLGEKDLAGVRSTRTRRSSASTSHARGRARHRTLRLLPRSFPRRTMGPCSALPLTSRCARARWRSRRRSSREAVFRHGVPRDMAVAFWVAGHGFADLVLHRRLEVKSPAAGVEYFHRLIAPLLDGLVKKP